MTENYVEPILDALVADPHRVACHLADGTSVTRGELAGLAYRLARVLDGRGIGPGSTVTILTANRPETLAARYAANLLGARVVTLYEGLSAATHAAMVSDVDTDVLVADARAEELLDLLTVKTVLGLGPNSPGEDLLALAAVEAETPLPPFPVSASDVFCVRHTGGTTGRPKGILWSHRVQAGMVGFMSTLAGPDVVQLVCTPLAHVAGMASDAVLTGGGTLVVLPRFDAGEVLAAIEAHRVTQVTLLPALLYDLMDHPAIDNHDLSSLRHIGYGGSPVSPGRVREALERFGPILSQVYASNETGGITQLGMAEHGRPELLDTVGRPHPGVELAIRAEDGTDLPPGERGEICVRSAMSGLGYWRDPEATARVWRDGWVHTGDVGYVDDEGYLRVSGRLKEVIIVVGGHVHPPELEDVLLRHPAVAKAAVFGVTDADRRERVHAAIVPRLGHTTDLDELRTFVTARHGAMYAPHEVWLRDEIPLTEAGKPDVKRLRAEHVQGVG